jgi:hypothetical protein
VAPNGKRFYSGERCDLATYSGVIVAEKSAERLKWDVGYRLSQTHINDYAAFNIDGTRGGLKDVTPVTDVWEEPVHNLSAGAGCYLAEGRSLHVNVAAGHVEPRPGTLTTDFEEPGNETRVKLDLGLALALPGGGGAAGGGKLSATTFYVYQDEAIVLSGTTYESPPGSGIWYELYLNRDQDQYGIELDARAPRSPAGVSWFANVVAMASRKQEGGEYVRNLEVPQVIAGAGVEVARGDLAASVLLKYVSEYENTRFLPSGEPPAPLGDFFDIGLALTWAFGPLKKHTAFVTVDNLADEEYSTVPGYPNSGRKFTAGVRSRF